jgi:hypothetical protein
MAFSPKNLRIQHEPSEECVHGFLLIFDSLIFDANEIEVRHCDLKVGAALQSKNSGVQAEAYLEYGLVFILTGSIPGLA